MAEREEEPEGIAGVIRCEKPFFGPQYGTASPRKKAACVQSAARAGNFRVKPGLDLAVFVQSVDASGG
jgi:hypothetical protein